MILWIVIILVIIVIVALLLVWNSTSITDKTTWYMVIIGIFVFMVIIMVLWWWSTSQTPVATGMPVTTHTEVWHDTQPYVVNSQVQDSGTHHTVVHDHFHHNVETQATGATAYVESVAAVPVAQVVSTASVASSRSVPPEYRVGNAIPEGTSYTVSRPVGQTTINPAPTAVTTTQPGTTQWIRVRDENGVVQMAEITHPPTVTTRVENRPPVRVKPVPAGTPIPPGVQRYTPV